MHSKYQNGCRYIKIVLYLYYHKIEQKNEQKEKL